MKFFLKFSLLICVVIALGACSTNRANHPDHGIQGSASGAKGLSNAESQKSEETASFNGSPENDGGQSLAQDEKCPEEIAKEAQEVLDEALEFCRTSQDFWSKGDFENAIGSLDHAYNLILQADTSQRPKLIQQKEDIRFMICKRMLEIYASQSTVVNGNHNAIPMVMNRHVQKEIKLFQGPERKFFLQSYVRSGRYRDKIVKDMQDAGLPEELSWLPLIESGFKVKALSSARALGPWQFIPSTGYKFGLQRDQWVDERMDVNKATQAAIAYMKELHKLFGDWSTVLAAYNCGEYRVLRVIRSQNINYLDNFWDLFEKLPWETARYVPRFLASLHIINNPEKYGFDLPERDPPAEYETVTVAKQMRLKDIAAKLEVDYKDLELLNSELRYKVTTPTAYKLKVPVGKGEVLTASLDDIPSYTPPKRYYEYHRVRKGDTLSGLARRYRSSVRSIMKANNLSKSHYIRVGQKLKIPTRYSSTPAIAVSKMTSTDKTKPLHHRVKRGDSLWVLARAYHTTIQEIMRLNGLSSTRLHTGQVLVIRKGITETEIGDDTKKYHVKRGDSPYQIATAHQMKLERFLRLNDLTPRSKIFPGQILLVDAGK